jgi:hypothetical protein
LIGSPQMDAGIEIGDLLKSRAIQSGVETPHSRTRSVFEPSCTLGVVDFSGVRCALAARRGRSNQCERK